MSEAAVESRLLGAREVAARLGISTRKVQELAKAGEISHLRVPPPHGRVLFEWAEVERWLDEKCRRPAAG